MAQSCDTDLWVMKWRSAWSIFHSPVVLPYMLKTISCMYMIMNQYDPMFDLKNKCRSLWPIFYGPVILPCILKTIWCMNIIIWIYESVWPDIWPQNNSRSMWPIFHGPVILSYILRLFDVWTSYFRIIGKYGPQSKCKSLWPIFHSPVILPYILTTIWCIYIVLWDYESVWPGVWPQNKCRSLWPIFYGQVICLVSWRLFDVWTILFRIMSQYDLKINIGHFDL